MDNYPGVNTYHFRRVVPRRAVLAIIGLIVTIVAGVAYMVQRPEASFWPVAIAIFIWAGIMVAFTSAKDCITIESEGIRSKRFGFIRWTDITRCTIDDLRSPPNIVLHLKKGRWTFSEDSMMSYQEKQEYEEFLHELQKKLGELPAGGLDAGEESASIPIKKMTDVAWLRWLVILLIPLLVIGMFIVPGRVAIYLPLVIPIIGVVLFKRRNIDNKKSKE